MVTVEKNVCKKDVSGSEKQRICSLVVVTKIRHFKLRKQATTHLMNEKSVRLILIMTGNIKLHILVKINNRRPLISTSTQVKQMFLRRLKSTLATTSRRNVSALSSQQSLKLA